MDANIKFEKSKIIVDVIPNEVYNEKLIEVVKQLSYTYQNICYITINTVYKVLRDNLLKEGIDLKKFFFIDGITNMSRQEPENVENCIFVDAPNSLTEISHHVTRLLNLHKFDCFLFDSLSTLLIYDTSPAATQFAHFVIENFRQYKCTAIFTALESDIESQLINDIGLFADEIHARNEKFNEKIAEGKMQKLEKELAALEQGYKTKFISEESYQKESGRIKIELQKLKK